MRNVITWPLASPDVGLGVAGNWGQPALAWVPRCEGTGPQLEVIHAENIISHHHDTHMTSSQDSFHHDSHHSLKSYYHDIHHHLWAIYDNDDDSHHNKHDHDRHHDIHNDNDSHHNIIIMTCHLQSRLLENTATVEREEREVTRAGSQATLLAVYTIWEVKADYYRQ